MKSEEINKILNDIYSKENISIQEKKALLEACECVWASKSNKVEDVESFMNMLKENMAIEYDVTVKSSQTETLLSVKIYKN